jgi:predicted aspartyl protease
MVKRESMKMGETRVAVNVYGPTGSANIEMVADTGATLTMIPESVADSIGIVRRGSVMVRLADGTTRRVPVGCAEIEVGGDRAPVRVIIGSEGVATLGVTALETLGLKVNPVERRLEPSIFSQYALGEPRPLEIISKARYDRP